MYCTRMRAKSREAALFPSSFLLPSHAEVEGLGIGLHCHAWRGRYAGRSPATILLMHIEEVSCTTWPPTELEDLL